MIVRAARLAGAILVECADQYFLVGNTKEPCDWPASGFNKPPEPVAGQIPVLAMESVQQVRLAGSSLIFEWNGNAPESCAHVLAKRLLIQRNGSVSERLWRLVTGESDESIASVAETEATWLVQMPEAVWNIIRENVLKCL